MHNVFYYIQCAGWAKSYLSLACLSTTLFTKKKNQPHTARCLCKRSQAVRRVAAAHLVCYGHFSPGRRLSPPETPPEASSSTAAKQFQVPPVSARRLSGERALKDLFFSSSPLDSHVVEHRFCIICITGFKTNPTEHAASSCPKMTSAVNFDTLATCFHGIQFLCAFRFGFVFKWSR